MSHPQLFKSWLNGSPPHPEGITPRFVELEEKKFHFFLFPAQQILGKGLFLLIKNQR
jgi:hypothetical protein